MQICVIVGLASVVLWVRLYLIEREMHLFRLAALSVGSSALVALEILDFPPIYGLIDAHALWHLGIGYIFFSFFLTNFTAGIF